MNALLPNPTRQSPTTGWNVPHLIFAVDSQPYACPIARVERLMLLSDAEVEPSPQEAPVWEAGRLAASKTHAGMPIISLRSLWGAPRLANAEEMKKQALMIVQVAGQLCALLVDACLNVAPQLPPVSAGLYLPPKLKNGRGQAFKIAIPWKETLLVILELNDLLRHLLAGGNGVAPASGERV